MLYRFKIEDRSDTNCWKNTYLYHIQNIRSGKLTDLLHSQLITCTMKVSEFKNKKAYLGAVKFKTKNQKFLGRLLIFTPIPLNAQDVWSLNQFPRREYESVQRSHTNHFMFSCDHNENHSENYHVKKHF